MAVGANRWSGQPANLSAQITPLVVQLRNETPAHIRVSYADFQVTDEAGNRYTTLNAYHGPSPTGANEAVLDRSALRSAVAGVRIGVRAPALRPRAVVVVPLRGRVLFRPGVRASMRTGWMVRRPMVVSRVHLRGGAFIGPGFRSGAYITTPNVYYSNYYFYPGYRAWYPGYSWYFDAPYAYPAVYWSNVNYVAAWYDGPTDDLVTYGLPEGVLAPGGTAVGFLYFKNATAGNGRLNLSWNAVNARTGETVVLQTGFSVAY